MTKRKRNDEFPLVVAHLIGLFLNPEDGSSTFSEMSVIASHSRSLQLIITAVRTSNLVYSEICLVYSTILRPDLFTHWNCIAEESV